jgi:hypothetical protein
MNKLTEEYCKSVAMSCETTLEFWNKHRSVAMKAQKMGWYESYTWLRRDRVPRNYWTYENCKAEASKFKTIEEFRSKSSSAYVIANKKGWLKSFGLGRKMGEKHFWTEDTCRTEALKYKTLGDFRNGSPSAYYMAVHKGWIPSFTFLERQRKIRKKKEN